MIGKGTFKELSKSGIDFSSLLKHDDTEDRPASPTVTQIFQRSMSHDSPAKSHDQMTDVHSKSHEHISGNRTELRSRLRLDSSCSRHSMYESMMSLTSEGDFEV